MNARVDKNDVPPSPVLRADLASFPGAGYGTLRILKPGQIIAVTDAEADTLAAEVLAVRETTADVRVRWHHDERTP